MPRTPWDRYRIEQCERETGHALLNDAVTLASYSGDFGRLTHSAPAAVVSPSTVQALQQIIGYANTKSLPVTLRANGLSQCGQTLAVAGGLTVHMDRFNTVDEPEDAFVWTDANATWAELLAATLPRSRVPYVTPYNTNLSVAGLLSVGGVGAASFRHGVAASYVHALEVVTADGELRCVGPESPLFQACLAGLGQFGVIARAAIRLRPCGKQVRTYFLSYLDKGQWLKDLTILKSCADFLETVCSPALQGTKVTVEGRRPFAEWLFALQVSFEYDGEAPELADLAGDINPWKISHRQDEAIEAYLLRHNARFDAMKLTGQWDLQHPWYECLVPQAVMLAELDDLLDTVPLYYATVVHLVPIARREPAGFFMAPDEPEFFSVMILNPGVPSALVPGCLETIKRLDARFLAQGGKRYLAGYLGSHLQAGYWKAHFAPKFEAWLQLKERYDPNGIFCSALLDHASPEFRSARPK